MAPDVSVLLTCYNEGASIGEAIVSITRQTAFGRVARILVIDDGSTDDSIAILNAKAAALPRLEFRTL